MTAGKDHVGSGNSFSFFLFMWLYFFLLRCDTDMAISVFLRQSTDGGVAAGIGVTQAWQVLHFFFRIVSC